jgi:hypothetical protein
MARGLEGRLRRGSRSGHRTLWRGPMTQTLPPRDHGGGLDAAASRLAARGRIGWTCRRGSTRSPIRRVTSPRRGVDGACPTRRDGAFHDSRAVLLGRAGRRRDHRRARRQRPDRAPARPADGGRRSASRGRPTTNTPRPSRPPDGPSRADARPMPVFAFIRTTPMAGAWPGPRSAGRVSRSSTKASATPVPRQSLMPTRLRARCRRPQELRQILGPRGPAARRDDRIAGDVPQDGRGARDPGPCPAPRSRSARARWKIAPGPRRHARALARDAARLDAMLAARDAELVGGTTLFRTYSVRDARPCRRGWRGPHLGRVFPYSETWVRSACPAGRTTGAAFGTR